MPLIGDFSRFGGLHANIARLAQVPSRAAGPASDRINELIQEGYRNGTDPYGRPWAPLRPSTLARGRTPPPLTASGDMARRTVAAPLQSRGIGVSLPFPGRFHQGGTSNMVARPPLPRGGRLPATWSAAVRVSTLEAYRGAR